MTDDAACSHSRPRWRVHRGLLALLLATALATCTSDRPTGPGRGAVGYLAFRPVLVSPVDLTAFGLTIDSLRVAAIRPVADTVVDTTVFFDPNASSLTLKLPVELRSSSESFQLLLELRAGRLVLFSIMDTVVVSAGAPDTAFTPTDTLKYVGPGAGITHIQIAPGDSVVTETQTAAFRVTADAGGTPVDSFYVSWSTSDTTVARINAAGVLRAPNARGALFVRAVVPNGVKDSTRITFIPVPNAIALVSGGGQTGVVATQLPLPLAVKVTATDGLGIKGIPVRFQAPASGSVRDSVVVTDSAGVAQDTVTLGTTAGTQNFQATVTGLAPAVIPATGTAGAIAPALSVVTVSAGTVASGTAVTLRLQTRDAFGNNLTTGGATVVFSDSGGTSTGVIGSTTDNGDGTYQASFRGGVAGTPTSIKATVNGILVTTARPTVAVTAGAISALTSVVTTSSDTVSSGSSGTLTLQAKDSAGNSLSSGGATVVFTHTGGTSTVSIGTTTDHANGTYTALFTADSAGTATTVHATIGGAAVASTTTITVVPGNTVAAQSVITVSADTIPSGGTSILTLQAKDTAGNNITTGGLTVVFSFSGGTSTGTIAPSPATDHGDGTYTATFTGVTPGTATTIHATIGAAQVTSTLPTITVFSSVHVSDITADSTWTAAASPHIVNGYLKIMNGAKLTIQAGAVVKFNAGSGLQVGDTAASQSGDLALDGTGALITLTANAATPGVGFWKGIEVQHSLTPTTWRNVLIEWAGGTRAPAGAVAAEACVLLVDNSGAGLDLDSLHIRQCNHAAIHHFGGTAHVHRSEIDTVTGSGIHVDFNGQLELDSTTIRGAGQEGLFFGSLASRLLPSSANQFRNNAVTGIHLNAFQLPGLLQQDSIVGNGTNFIIVDGGQPDPSAVAFTMFAQPQPVGLDGYLIQNGSMNIGRVGGQALTLDSNVVLRFNGQTGLVIGDSAGTRSGTLRSLATSPANRAVLLGSAGSFPGAWVGVEIGRLSGADTLRFVRIVDAGDSVSSTPHRSGLWMRNPVAVPFVLDGANISGSGGPASPKNSAGVVVTGTGGTVIRNSELFQNTGFGIALADRGFKVLNDTIDGHVIGVATFMQGGSQLLASDSISGNTFPGTQYALSMTAAGLRALQANGITTAASDTLLLTGGLLTANATLPTFPGYVWHATAMTNIDSSAILTISPGDTIAFDSLAGILVGSNSDGGLAALGTAPAPILFTTSYTPTGLRPRGFNGVEWRLPTPSGNSFTYVTVDQGGYVFQPQCDCSQIQIGALRFADTSQATTVNLTLDHITVRRSFAFAVDMRRSGTGTVTITNSQFYENDGFDPMIRAFSSFPNQFTISGSDLYHYRGWVIQASDTVLATNNWWGDVAGLDSGFPTQDSLGRAALEFNPVRFTPFALTPFFPVGPAVGLVPTADSVLSPALSTTDSIRVRAVDGVGRGVAGGTVSWSVAPLGQSTIAPTSGPVDAGGRADANWTFTTSAGTKIATASGVGTTQYVANVQPGLTVSRDWTLLGPLSQGTVTAPKAITFTSTNRRGVLITKSVDSNGNPTQAFYCTATPGFGCVGFSYATIDSVHTSGGADGDSVFFHATVTTPNPFVLRGQYSTALGLAFDSVLITMNPAAAGVKIDRDEFTNGVQTTPDTAQFFSLCPGGQPNFYCEREFHAFVVDSGLAPIDNPGALFTWNLLPPTGAPVTFTTRGAPANDTATVDAQANGFARLVVTDVSSGNFGADTLPILVTQLPGIIFVTPPVDSVAVGGTATFVGTAVDLGGDTMSTVPIHWRNDNTFNPHLTIIDTATPHQVVVRLDSTPFSGEFITAFAVRGPGDTIFGSAEVVNPLVLPIDVGAQPWAITASAVTHTVYAGHQDGELFRIDGPAGTATQSVMAGSTISAVAVNAVTNRVFAATDSGVVVLAGVTLSRVKPAPIAVGKNDQGVQNRQGLTVDSINNKIYVTVIDVAGASPKAVLRRIDGDTNGFSPTNDTPLPDTGNGAVFNPNDGFVYVTIPDSNLVVAVNPATHLIVKRIPVGSEPFAIALNPVTNRLYVIDQINTQNFPYNLYVIDPVAGAVTATVFTPYLSGSLTVDAVNNRVYLGAKFLPYLSVYDGSSNTFVGLVVVSPFSDSLFGVAFDAGDGNVYTANYSSNTVTRLKY